MCGAVQCYTGATTPSCNALWGRACTLPFALVIVRETHEKLTGPGPSKNAHDTLGFLPNNPLNFPPS